MGLGYRISYVVLAFLDLAMVPPDPFENVKGSPGTVFREEKSHAAFWALTCRRILHVLVPLAVDPSPYRSAYSPAVIESSITSLVSHVAKV
jgi:hypothetical protein